MGNRRVVSKQILASTAISSTTTYTSSWMAIESFNDVGFQAIFTSTATGTLTVETSHDAPLSVEGSVNTPTNFVTASFYRNYAVVANVAITAGLIVAGELPEITANWVRVKYINSLNSGTITVNMTAKARG
jgi:hypothetical protein